MLAWTMLYVLRALTEEDHLRKVDGDYAAYAASVRYRFIPGLDLARGHPDGDLKCNGSADFSTPCAGAPARLRAAMLCVLAAACAYRVWLVASFNPMDAIWSDPARHWNFGTHPLDTQPLVAIDPVGYQVYLGILAKLTAGSAMLVGYWTALLSLAGPWLWYRFLRELLPSRDWALAGWILLAALPSWTAIYSYFMQETLMLPLLGAALWATWRCRRKEDLASFVVAVGFWMLAGLTRGICIPLAAVAMGWLWFEQGEKLRKPPSRWPCCLRFWVRWPDAAGTWCGRSRLTAIGSMAQALCAGRNAELFDRFHAAGRHRTMELRVHVSCDEPPAARAVFGLAEPPRSGTHTSSIDLDAGGRDWRAAKAAFRAWDLERAAWLTRDNLINLFFSPLLARHEPEEASAGQLLDALDLGAAVRRVCARDTCRAGVASAKGCCPRCC